MHFLVFTESSSEYEHQVVRFSRMLVEKTQRFSFGFGQHQRNKSTVLFCISGWLELIIIENKEFKAKCSKPLYQRTTALDSEI